MSAGFVFLKLVDWVPLSVSLSLSIPPLGEGTKRFDSIPVIGPRLIT